MIQNLKQTKRSLACPQFRIPAVGGPVFESAVWFETSLLDSQASHTSRIGQIENPSAFAQ
jgi:hypothetical protein